MTVAAIQQRWGPQALRRWGQGQAAASPPIPHIPTGFPTLDKALGIGGLPRSRVTEILGVPTSEMATLALGDPIAVQSDGLQTPRTFTWQGQAHGVQAIAKRWRVDVDWWRVRVWREYFKLTTHTGLLVVIYRDLLTGRWYLQRLYD
jgi:hypothetical protein